MTRVHEERRPGYAFFGLFLSLLSSACVDTTTQPRASSTTAREHAAPPKPAVVAKETTSALRVPVPGQQDTYFSVHPQACPGSKDTGCPFEVSVIVHGQVRSKQTVDWAPAIEPFLLQQGTSPSNTDWTTGDGNSELTTTATLVRLAPGVSGLLITQETHGDHAKRADHLFALHGDNFEKVWSFDEDSGPTWSEIRVIPVDDQHEAILLIEGASLNNEVPDEPDTCNVHLVHWDNASAKILDEQAGAHAYATVLGPFANLSQARGMKVGNPNCIGDSWLLLPARQFADAGPSSGFVLAMLESSKADAQRTLDSVLLCNKAVPGKVTTLGAVVAPAKAVAAPAQIVTDGLRAPVLGQEGNYFELRPQACPQSKQKGCPFEVRFFANGQPRAKRDFAWEPAVEPWSMQRDIFGVGGDPNAPQAFPGWTTTNSQVRTIARAITLAPGIAAVLVDQLADFHGSYTRRHFLVAMLGESLQQVWSADKLSTRAWSTTEPIALDAQHTGILVLADIHADAAIADQADVVDATVVRWEPTRAQVVQEAGGSRAYAAVLGPLASLAVAKQLREQVQGCMKDLWLLPSDAFVDFESSGSFVLAAIGATEQGAHKLLESSLACWQSNGHDVAKLPNRLTTLR